MQSVATTLLIAASKNVIETPTGGFYECSNSGCRPNSYTYNENVSDSRNITLDGEQTGTFLGFPIYEKIRYQYIGCYEYKSNGSGITCEDFHGTNICEGTQWDLFINADGKYYVRSCPDGVH